jgi:ATP/maltotriose-dependent transcriptional regulator MalT
MATLVATEIDVLCEMGELDEALEAAADLAARIESADVWHLSAGREAQARILALRGQAAKAADSLDWIESTCRVMEMPQDVVPGLASVALARAGLGQVGDAARVLVEVEATPNAQMTILYPVLLPAMVRTALALGKTALAERLVSGLQPRYPYAEHALAAANAARTEARGDLQTAAAAYADAAVRWDRFGVIPEQAFALLGQGRCLLGLSRPTEAVSVLRQAREIFGRLKAAPALADTDVLLLKATALGS